MMSVLIWIWSFLKAFGLTWLIFWFLVKVDALDWLMEKATTKRRSWGVVMLIVVVFWVMVWVFF
ncbi:MAG TPA: hypothetical protein VK175_06085 [Leadbetterella sp.]|nr:hypothetical protein [Leadbetterella sp.]